ncbi:hypothetical protein DM860_004311 [Cuscuta australis]|uniref:Uncharacterized protein n=1 Tax=Cuscuta australis TaxID=267555 RepID=A0A328E8E6_9ASTE|nr:hypothetical protein DM860_004311 [Cuscuta australis]
MRETRERDIIHDGVGESVVPVLENHCLRCRRVVRDDVGRDIIDGSRWWMMLAGTEDGVMVVEKPKGVGA